MIIVDIRINNRLIKRYTALNIGKADKEPRSQWRKYKAQDGTVLEHRRDDGASFLAEKLLSQTEGIDMEQN